MYARLFRCTRVYIARLGARLSPFVLSSVASFPIIIVILTSVIQLELLLPVVAAPCSVVLIAHHGPIDFRSLRFLRAYQRRT